MSEQRKERPHFRVEFMHGQTLVERTDEGLFVHGFVKDRAKLGRMKYPDPIPSHLERDVAEAIWEAEHVGKVYFRGGNGFYVMQEDGSARFEETDLPAGPVGIDPEEEHGALDEY
jgi:hypothetical protein